MSTTSTTTKVAADPVVTALSKLLAESYALMAQTHLAHWNVEGPDFFQLHAAFESQYKTLFEAVDIIAEQIRTLNSYSPGGLEQLAELSDLTPMPGGRQSAKDFVAQLIDGHEKAVATAKEVEKAAGEVEDLETQDMAISRGQEHQKTLWMLNSFLK